MSLSFIVVLTTLLKGKTVLSSRTQKQSTGRVSVSPEGNRDKVQNQRPCPQISTRSGRYTRKTSVGKLEKHACRRSRDRCLPVKDLVPDKVGWFLPPHLSPQMPQPQASPLVSPGPESRYEYIYIHLCYFKITQKSSRKTYISALLTMPKPLTVWITINCGKF